MDAHYMKPDKDTPGYWRCFATCSDGRCVIGMGATEGMAVVAAEAKRQKHETFLALPPIDRLKRLLDGDLRADSKEALKIIGRLVIDLCEKDYAQH
jgi:hypothetical protein